MFYGSFRWPSVQQDINVGFEKFISLKNAFIYLFFVAAITWLHPSVVPESSGSSLCCFIKDFQTVQNHRIHVGHGRLLFAALPAGNGR